MRKGSILVFISVIIIIIGLITLFSLTHVIIPNKVNEPGNINSHIKSELPVGILVMQSGFILDIGVEYSRAFEMVRQDYPDSIIMPITMDGGSNASVASYSWKKMISDNPNLPLVVTVASWTTNVVYPGAAKSGIVQLALGSAVVNRSRSSDHLIRFTPGVEQESPLLAAYLNRFNRIAIIGGDNDYSRGYISALESLIPGKIIETQLYNPDNLDSTLNISIIKKNNPDVILLLSVSEGGKVIEIIRNAGINTALVGTRVIERNSLLESKETEGLIFTTPALNRSHPFFKRYFYKYRENATFYGAEGFDAMTTLYAAAAECGVSQYCISGWYKNRSFDGALGSVRFDDKGVAFYPITMKIIRNGRFENYSL